MTKKIILAILFLLLFLLIAAKIIFAPPKNVISYKLEGKKYILLTARTPQEWQKGLMYVRKLNNADGVIFLFPDKQGRTFWNGNTFVDLYLYWLDDDKVVGRSFLPSVEKWGIVTVSSPAPANKVIELIKR